MIPVGDPIDDQVIAALGAEIEWFDRDPFDFKGYRFAINIQIQIKLPQDRFKTDGPAKIRTQ